MFRKGGRPGENQCLTGYWGLLLRRSHLRLRSMVLTSTKSGATTPVVVVGTKFDLDTRELTRAETEARVMFEWNWGYKECSAKLGEGVSQVFGKYFRFFWLRQELKEWQSLSVHLSVPVISCLD